ncbi:MAG TPA: hypothetical protein VKX41_17360 [Alloacidobacterium sp.]|nr:hypothetical protein [Alloacidobacterium sp.]
MRYYKGYVALSDTCDVPILLQIRNARALYFEQLRDLILLDGNGIAIASLRWRVARMEKAGLIQRLSDQRHLGKPVFGITQSGLAFLESRGHFLLSLPSTAEQMLHPTQVPHALEMVNIRLALMKAGILRNWKTDLEIAARNLVLETVATKDFDAIAEIDVDGTQHCYAIEYERSPKSASRYRAIREVLDKDVTVDAVLYLTANDDILYLLALEMRGARKRIGFALSESFRQSLLDTRTLTNTPDSLVVPLRELIEA